MDCEMPTLNGFDASKKINEKIFHENYVYTAIIGYTALIGINEE